MEKYKTKTTFWIALLPALILTFSSCNDYLSTMPKGEKIPVTFTDFEALLRDEYGNHRTDIYQAILLLNDKFETTANLNYYPLRKANYNWNDSINRIQENKADETTYYNGYAAISTCNLLMEHVPGSTEATDEQKKELIAQAKVLRAMTYFYIVNYYADTYDESTAASKKAIPWITSANLNAPYTQVSIQAIYDHMLNDLKEAIPSLKESSATILHPNLGTAYALYARIYLQMGKYDLALLNAEEALKQNDQLFDWTQYYEKYKTDIENPNTYVKSPSPMDHNYVENYNFRHGGNNNQGSEYSLLVARAANFEVGDARFASRWKIRTVGADTYFVSTTTGYYNYGGLTTVEMYLIKAECLARAGKPEKALFELNAVRKKRILANQYIDLVATTEEQAMQYIRRTKENELLFSIIPFADARRWNKESKYARTWSKIIADKTVSLTPNSYLWTMPFPQGAIANPGNGSITQNVTQ